MNLCRCGHPLVDHNHWDTNRPGRCYSTVAGIICSCTRYHHPNWWDRFKETFTL